MAEDNDLTILLREALVGKPHVKNGDSDNITITDGRGSVPTWPVILLPIIILWEVEVFRVHRRRTPSIALELAGADYRALSVDDARALRIILSEAIQEADDLSA
ncbi:hypothetical protein ICV35_26865 [Rhodococcus ruber]|uniref:hypothetical protein n=1 Tax=Rhodococcus ruber TaxID=1830 RepID=UPI00177CD481|nr:hypothetical protein [Rhodococcus ruber]MBD8057263.1 hypothetical protein [Rhodococcus ruber]